MKSLIYALALSALGSLSWTTAAAASSIDARELRCMALNLYWEARAEGTDGMVAVAAVVLNRVRHRSFPDSVCAVIKQGGEEGPCQFSWWCDGRSDMPQNQKPWRQAERIAATVLRQPPADPTGGALFYHHTAILPPWMIKRQRTAVIGRHAFYR